MGVSLNGFAVWSFGSRRILYSTLGCYENPEYQKQEKPQLWDSVKTLVSNGKFWIAGFANAFYSATMSLVMASIPFFVKYVLNVPDAQAAFLFVSVLLIAIAAIGGWARLVKRYAVVPVWRAALLVLAVSFVPLYFVNSLVSAI